MDVAVEAGFFRLLQDLKEKRKKTLMVFLHNLSQALRYADYVAVLHERRVWLLWIGRGVLCVWEDRGNFSGKEV